jgi:multiple sugar transport system ATP-binding protein
VALGRAIVRKPAAFLFDEPLSNLDAKLRVEMRAELKKLHHRLQTTSIYVTHDQVEAMTLGNKIVILNNGVIQQVDNPLVVYEFPKNLFVAGFIGAPPMNFFKGTITRENGNLLFDEGSKRIRLPAGFAPAVSKAAGREVVFGIRPENLFISGQSAPEADQGSSLKAEVKVVEPLGSEMILYLSTARHDFIGRVDSHVRVDVGDVLDVGIELKKAHIFDPASGENLSLGADRNVN